jgi:hypothetical protein
VDGVQIENKALSSFTFFTSLILIGQETSAPWQRTGIPLVFYSLGDTKKTNPKK